MKNQKLYVWNKKERNNVSIPEVMLLYYENGNKD